MSFLQQVMPKGVWGLAWLDFLYPPVCEICICGLDGKREGVERWVCVSCHDELPALPATCCKVCGTPFEGEISDEFRCGNCADLVLHFDFATAAFHAEGEIRHLVHRFKYQKELYLRGLMSGLMADVFRRDARLKGLSREEWVLVPVPLHRLRLWQRGFNQSWELCLGLSQITQVPALNALQRVRYTRAQAKLGRSARMQNLKGSFRLRHRLLGDIKGSLEGKKVLLVDDVLTTGSTANECAKVLRREAGVQKVVVISLARG